MAATYTPTPEVEFHPLPSSSQSHSSHPVSHQPRNGLVSAPPPAVTRDTLVPPTSAVDPLVAGLLLAHERLAYHQSLLTTSLTPDARPSDYHAEAHTSLQVPVAAQMSPPLWQDVVDSSAAAPATSNGAGPRAPLQSLESLQRTSIASPHHDVKNETGRRKKRRASHKRQTHGSSRREHEHAARMKMALDPSFFFSTEAGVSTKEQRAAPNVPLEAGYRNLRGPRRSNSSSTKVEGPRAPASASALPQSPEADGRKASDDNPPCGDTPAAEALRHYRKGMKEAKRPKERQEVNADASNAVQAAPHHVKEAGLSGSDDEDQYDYRPNAEGAAEEVAERIRLLQRQEIGHDLVWDTMGMRGIGAFVRPADTFQSGPAPMWMKQYSDLLLFDDQRLDRHVAAAFAPHPERGFFRMFTDGGTGQSAEECVQLPVDAVLLRLRSSIARVRRLRDEVQRNMMRGSNSAHAFLHPDTHPERIEVYTAPGFTWGSALAQLISPHLPSSPETEQRKGIEVVVGQTSNDRNSFREGTNPNRPQKSFSSFSAVSPLTREMEAKDLQRSLLAQTVPVWRRRGAAVAMLTELLGFLESRLAALGAQLENAELGALIDRIGAPDSEGMEGTVEGTYPPALQWATRTTITNTLMSDLFSTSRSALSHRSLRLSNALRRRQTPYIHAEYLTLVEGRPVYDPRQLRSAAESSRQAVPQLVSPITGGVLQQRLRREGRSVDGEEDMRKSYSIHVDYVRFQPALMSPIAASLLRVGTGDDGHDGGAPLEGTDRNFGQHAGADSSSDEPLSSILLGAYSSVFFPSDLGLDGGGRETVSGAFSSLDFNRLPNDLSGASAALLLLLSSATAQNRLVTFTPEEYLTSLLLQYYEQYRLLQLNLLPPLKSRFFYQEQILQLQRQPQRNSDFDDLQRRLEVLAKTSANVERGCLQIMIVLWNSILILRRQQRTTAAYETSVAFGNDDDEPIIVASQVEAHRGEVGRQKRRRPLRRDGTSPSRSINNATTASPPLTAVQELRDHPPLFELVDSRAAEKEDQQCESGVFYDFPDSSNTPMIHRLENCVTCESENKGSGVGAEDRRFGATSASASPLLAPATRISMGAESDGHRRPGDRTIDNASPTSLQSHLTPQRFRFFLRRYGTTTETPYVMGDDLLLYAAEVQGTDIVAAAHEESRSGKQRGVRERSQQVPQVDELLYFQLVVFTRSHAAMVPQYVGCTPPRPMTSAKAVFFNETFEIRALREPQELLLHLIPVTTGPSKHTVVSTVRLRPTLIRGYRLLPLQPPTAFMFHGQLFRRDALGGAAENSGAPQTLAAAVSLHGVLAVSTAWTSYQGMTITQIEQLFLGGGPGGSSKSGAVPAAADPLDPQYLPLLCTLHRHYLELEDARANMLKGRGIRSISGRRRSRRDLLERHCSLGPQGRATSPDARMAHASDPNGTEPLQHQSRWRSADAVRRRRGSVPRLSGVRPEVNQRTFQATDEITAHGGRLGRIRDENGHIVRGEACNGIAPLRRRASSVAQMYPRSASFRSLQERRSGYHAANLHSPANIPNDGNITPGGAARLTSSARLLKGNRSNYAGLRRMRSMMQLVMSPSPVAVARQDQRAVDEVLQRLPSVRLQHLHQRWLIRTNRIKAATEVEARLLDRPIPLDEADGYQLEKEMKRTVEKEEASRLKDYGAAGELFNVEQYYTTPSAISGLALSPLPREIKLKLWQERQRRLLLTLKARQNLTETEKYEAVVRVPKLVTRLVFDFTPRSQLNPHRKKRPKTEEIDRALLARRQDSRIVIHIMKAHNLPIRADGTPLEPFVQASFVSEVAFTRSELGSSPSWFQSLELPFHPLNFEEETLGMIDDDIILSIYDKVEVKMAPAAATTAAVAHETHYRTERRFIGTLHLPFYALHQANQARMEGVFHLQMPRWALGYEIMQPYPNPAENGAANPQQESMLAGPQSPTIGGHWTGTTAPQGPSSNPLGSVAAPNTNVLGDALQSSPPTFPLVSMMNSGDAGAAYIEPTLQLYISLWPPLQREPRPPLSRAELLRKVEGLNVSPQLRYLHQVALRWQEAAQKRVRAIGTINALASVRQIDPFVPCSTGDLVLVCRYILAHGGPPPPTVRTVYEAIRYVSLLPFVSDMQSCGEKDVWCTNAELLAMRSGDYEELALLLVHFLRHLAPDRPTYAVIGSGTIYKQTIMVLHAFEDGDWVLINPRIGSAAYAIKPYGTDLRDVYAVVSHDQIWANVQLSGLPHRMTWDLASPAHWLPCFETSKDSRLALCTPNLFPIQREVLEFLPADAVKAREIEMELRVCLKKALLTWRNGCPPAYHRGVETILRELLEAAEAERCTCGSARRSDITRSAAARLSEYFGETVTGQPQDEPSTHHHRKHSQRHHTRGARDVGDTTTAEKTISEMSKEGTQNSALGAASPASPNRRTALEASSDTHLRLIGSPVMGSFNPLDPQFRELLQQIFECAVHEVGTSEASFAVGTYVKSYTGDVCAMWVFLVAICRG